MSESNLESDVPMKSALNRLFARGQSAELGLQFSERKAILMAGDLLLVSVALLVSLRFSAQYPTSISELWARLPWFFLLAGLWLAVGILFDIYDLARAASPMHSLWTASTAACVTLILFMLVPYISPVLPDRRLQLITFFVMTISGVALWRIIYANVFVQPAFNRTAIVVGAGWAGATLAQEMTSSTNDSGNPYNGTGYRLLAFVDDDPAKQGQLIAGIPVAGNRHDLIGLVESLRPDEIVVAIVHSDLIHTELFGAILECRERGIPITDMTSLYERLTGRVPLLHAGRELHVIMPMSHPPIFRLYRGLRQLMDVLFAMLGCLITLVLIPPIWLVNRFTSPGSVFYAQDRVGKGGATFRCYKFRSMIVDAERHSGAVWAQEKDERITPAGRILRKTRLDELPQFWNVLRGEMSLIGPRPERPEFVQQLVKDVPFYRIRHAIRPGITGWAQVNYRYGASTEDSLIKLQYDLYYIKHEGGFLDMMIMIKTLQTVLGLKGR